MTRTFCISEYRFDFYTYSFNTEIQGQGKIINPTKTFSIRREPLFILCHHSFHAADTSGAEKFCFQFLQVSPEAPHTPVTWFLFLFAAASGQGVKAALRTLTLQRHLLPPPSARPGGQWVVCPGGGTCPCRVRIEINSLKIMVMIIMMNVIIEAALNA